MLSWGAITMGLGGSHNFAQVTGIRFLLGVIEAGLFRSDAAHSTVHSALLTLRRRLDEVEKGLGPTFVRASARGYNLVAVP